MIRFNYALPGGIGLTEQVTDEQAAEREQLVRQAMRDGDVLELRADSPDGRDTARDQAILIWARNIVTLSIDRPRV